MTVRKIPESIRRAIADPLVLGDVPALAWKPPADLPPIADVRKALPILRADLEPALAKDAKWCLRKLAKCFGIVLDDDAQQRWLAANGKVPHDLWQKATLAWMQGETKPTADDFQRPVADVLQQRKTALARTEAIIAKLTAPKPAAPFQAEPTEVRVRTLLKWAQHRHDTAKAARLERELAQLEGREPEAWAASHADEKRDTPTEPTPARREIQPSPTMQAALTRARSRFWREQGREEFADRLDREADALAPEHREEPMGAAA